MGTPCFPEGSLQKPSEIYIVLLFENVDVIRRYHSSTYFFFEQFFETNESSFCDPAFLSGQERPPKVPLLAGDLPTCLVKI
jgi:hypothetical protein